MKKLTVSAYLFILFGFFMVCIFIVLGTWQLARKTEKEALLHSLATAWEGEVFNIDEIKMPTPLKPYYAQGHYLPGKTIFLQSKTHQGRNGIYILDVFQTLQGKYLLVQRGWSAKEHKILSSDNLKIEGIVRAPSLPTYFQPINKPPFYFWIDLAMLSQELKVPLLPYYMVARSSDDPQILPTEPMPLPRNNHLEYAITWYALAFSVLIMLLWNVKNYFIRNSHDNLHDNS